MPLVVDTGIPYGNGCDVSVEQGTDGATVGFAADPHGGPETLWFCFRLRRTGRDARRPIGKVRLVLKHLNNMLGAAKPECIRPVIRRAGGDWERLGPGVPEDLPDGRRHGAWELDLAEPRVDVATCYPYGTPEVDALVRETDGFYRADVIGVSQAGRPLVRLSNTCGEVGGKRPGLYLLARQHSGETPGSWVLDGLLRQLATCGGDTPLVWAVPLANIDGVEQGDYGKDNFPYDLNRAWGRPPMRHEVLVFQRDMTRWRERCRPLLAMDFHAPGLAEVDGSYLYLPKPDPLAMAHAQAQQWADRFAAALTPEFAAAAFGRVAGYASRWESPTFTAYCGGTLGVCGLTMETPYSVANGRVLTREDYREHGRRLARCLVEHTGAGG